MRHLANTIEDMKKLLVGYRDNMRVEIESSIAVTAKTVADLRAVPTWPDGLVLDIHVDLFGQPKGALERRRRLLRDDVRLDDDVAGCLPLKDDCNAAIPVV